MSLSLYVGPDSQPDKYRLVRSVGRGGEATLYLAEVTLAGQTEPVVVKALDADVTTDPAQFAELSSRWAEQAELLRFINRLGVVGVREHFEGAPEHPEGRSGEYTERCLYLVMNHIDGLDLRDWRAEHAEEGPHGQREALRHLEQVAQVLDMLHSGRATPSRRPVVHGDLSPGNVMIDADGQATLVDFGLSRIAARHMTARPWFTPGYAAPEIFGGEYSPATDRYAFGAVAFYALTGEDPPPAPEQLRERFAALPLVADAGERTRALIVSMFSAEPGERPGASDWVRALRTLATSVPWTGPGHEPGGPVVDGDPGASAVFAASLFSAVADGADVPDEPGGSDEDTLATATFAAPDEDTLATAKIDPSALPGGAPKGSAPPQGAPFAGPPPASPPVPGAPPAPTGPRTPPSGTDATVVPSSNPTPAPGGGPAASDSEATVVPPPVAEESRIEEMPHRPVGGMRGRPVQQRPAPGPSPAPRAPAGPPTGRPGGPTPPGGTARPPMPPPHSGPTRSGPMNPGPAYGPPPAYSRPAWGPPAGTATGAFPAHGAPPAPEAPGKKSRKPLIIGLAVVTVLGMFGGAALTYVVMDRGLPFLEGDSRQVAADAPGEPSASEEAPPAAGLPTEEESASAADTDGSAGDPAPGDSTLLTQLEIVDDDGYWRPETGRAEVDGQAYTRAIVPGFCMQHSSSCDGWADYNLGRKWSTFTATIGVDDNSSASATTTFTVYTDGEPEVTETLRLGETLDIEVDVRDALRLRIEVDSDQNGVYPVWADPTLTS
ncbi:protein kinase domain-containing protein [Nocardiopsis lambiniae]|uniref:non-specific serine/threonine protein kinase n=1 Tax=Nocardiopsis lambiniae TaxID=3075539 RepID=A0ABU2MBJ6_9ACTN|nr:NPCBM/NEW2 domain-containing protein [Nocardiopsis sp. DSM 44743]MDT0329950.1 NPCBM/NEW2 domain-containing protein [Nocardiopsis sp. DSM 44743]